MKNKIVSIITIFCLSLIILINFSKALTLKTIMQYEVQDEKLLVKVRIDNLELDSNPVNAISANIEYDKNLLNLDSIVGLNAWTSTYSETNNKITLIKLNGTEQSEEIFEIKFSINDKESLNGKEISINNITISDGNKEENIEQASVKIVLLNTITNTSTNKINNNTNNTINNNKVENNVNKVENQVTNTVNTVNNKTNTKVNNIYTNSNKTINTQKQNNISNLEVTNTNSQNMSVVGTIIPYAGIRNYIIILILIILIIAICIYIRYKKIDKIC